MGSCNVKCATEDNCTESGNKRGYRDPKFTQRNENDKDEDNGFAKPAKNLESVISSLK